MRARFYFTFAAGATMGEGEDGCMCMRVYVYMCVCVRGEKKERCLQPMDRGEGMTCGSNRD